MSLVTLPPRTAGPSLYPGARVYPWDWTAQDMLEAGTGTDIRTRFEGAVEGADYAVDMLGLTRDGGLGTAIVLSLFSDRRAGADDTMPDGVTDRRGWWGDIAPLASGYQLGSRLWLLAREKELPETLERARSYAEEALAWLVTSGAASAVAVTTSVPRRGVLGISIEVARPSGVSTYDYQWQWMGSQPSGDL